MGVLVALAVLPLAFAVWQVAQIVRWPEGRKLMQRMDDMREHHDWEALRPVLQPLPPAHESAT